MFEELWRWSGPFLQGSLVILLVFLVSLVLTVIWGLIGASAKLSSNRVARGAANAYTVIFRGTPEFLVLLLLYFGSAITLTALAKLVWPQTRFVDLSPFWAGSIAISMIVGAAATETFRGAFLGVDQGQVEAGRALGLRRFQVFILIRLPQMWRLALPSFGNHLNSLVKDTALISVIGLQEIMFTADMAASTNSMPFAMYFTVALIYLAFTTVVTVVIRRLERRANHFMVAAR
ncbi:ABC transporter permease [Bosea sp. UC22_33]|uniref:ABC transporter permease n=1 Tax=Bosea sp. UC22_33 TaxID=3350165 RepID=UPI003672FEB8